MRTPLRVRRAFCKSASKSPNRNSRDVARMLTGPRRSLKCCGGVYHELAPKPLIVGHALQSDTFVRGINVKLRILSTLDFYLACINVSSRLHCKNFTSSSRCAESRGIRSVTAQGVAFSKD